MMTEKQKQTLKEALNVIRRNRPLFLDSFEIMQRAIADNAKKELRLRMELSSAEEQFTAYKKKVEYEIALDYASK